MVRLHNVTVMAAPQPCFIFTHPNRGLWAIVVLLFVCLEKSEQVLLRRKQNEFCFLTLVVSRIDNSRMKSLEFEVKISCTLHGFAGYFEAILYKDIMLSKLHHVTLIFDSEVKWIAVLLLLRLGTYLFQLKAQPMRSKNR